jgi:uncharacterized damage-inducible protein DinB
LVLLGKGAITRPAPLSGTIMLFPEFSAYNEWANDALYACAAQLDENERRADCGLFFTSVHGTLNHLYVADDLWMWRFTGEGQPKAARLDAILFEDFVALREARQRLDRRIIDYIAGLDEAMSGSTITYKRLVGAQTITQPLSSALLHFFNHQTHHRGQIHAALTQLRGNDFAPSLDMLNMQRNRP